MKETAAPAKLTGDRALELLREVVAGRGDHVYARRRAGGVEVCRYAWDGEPDCLVGHVLHAAGWDMSRLDGETRPVADLDGFDMDASYILDRAREAQDAGLPWADALAMAEDMAERWGVIPESAVGG